MIGGGFPVMVKNKAKTHTITDLFCTIMENFPNMIQEKETRDILILKEETTLFCFASNLSICLENL